MNLLLAVSAAGIVGLAVAYYVWQRKKSKSPTTLLDPDVKYPLKLVDKEIVSHDTRWVKLFG